MPIHIVREDPKLVLHDYSQMPIAFEVRSQLSVKPVNSGLGGLVLVEEKVSPPYLKDYDQFEADRPTAWNQQWDISNWCVLSAFDGRKRIGGATVAWHTPEVNMLEGRVDLAVLWDIRIDPAYRRRKIGAKLFAEVARWAKSKNCRTLKVETQNNNVAACRFYAAQGCELRAIRMGAYPDLPSETQLLWYLDL